MYTIAYVLWSLINASAGAPYNCTALQQFCTNLLCKPTPDCIHELTVEGCQEPYTPLYMSSTRTGQDIAPVASTLCGQHPRFALEAVCLLFATISSSCGSVRACVQVLEALSSARQCNVS